MKKLVLKLLGQDRETRIKKLEFDLQLKKQFLVELNRAMRISDNNMPIMGPVPKGLEGILQDGKATLEDVRKYLEWQITNRNILLSMLRATFPEEIDEKA